MHNDKNSNSQKMHMHFNSNSNACVHCVSGHAYLCSTMQLPCSPGSEHTACTLGTEFAITPHTNQVLKVLSSDWRLLTCNVFRHRFQVYKSVTGKD